MKKVFKIGYAVTSLVYIGLVIYVTFFARRRKGPHDYRALANWSMFDDWTTYAKIHEMTKAERFSFLENFWGNILMFIPLPFVIYFVLGRQFSLIKTILMIFITSVLIEILQYVFNKGVSDAGDVLLNFIGGIIGILLFKVILKLVLQFNKS